MRLLALLSLLVALAAPGQAQTTSRLNALDTSRQTTGWEAIGRIDIGDEGYCTGTLIAADLVLTAAHCIFDKASKRLREPDELLFRAGFRKGHADAERRVARMVHDPRYRQLDKPTHATVLSDIALLQLAEPIPSSIADPFAVHSGAAARGPLSVISYGRGRSDAMSWQRNCNLLNRARGVIIFDCSVTYGSSGSAVFMREHGRYRVFSVVSAVGHLGGKPAGFGMELGGRVRELEARLRAVPLQGEAGAKRLKVGSSTARRAAGGARFLKVGD